MSALYDNAALRALERRAQHLAGIDETTLMRRAGLAAWRCVLREFAGPRRLLVLCGPGNNGGDGWVLALHALQSGLDVCAVHLPEHSPRTVLATRMAEEYRAAGGRIDVFSGTLPAADVIVDAIFGIGLNRAPDAASSELIAKANAAGVPILALDVPSGANAERGDVPGQAIVAQHTVQFIAAHAGLYTGAARDRAGALSLATLDVPAACFDGLVPLARLQAKPSLPPRPLDSHKGRFGHGLVIGGDAGMGGAALLASEAALRSGIGLISVATRAAHLPAFIARRPEAMAHAADDLATMPALIAAADAVAIGPGLGQGDWARQLLAGVAESHKPCVIDADALNLFAAAPFALPPQAVLTPHPGEAARLLGSDVAGIQSDRFAAANTLAERHRCSVILKGSGTIITAPGRSARVLGNGNPGMASGGMGDALTGVVLALLARGFAAFEAAAIGAWLHGDAGDRAANAGQAGLLATDLIEQLRAAQAECR
ncbi:MAG: NAD(P)H-hydrate dehydratase [Pseudomonadota bacterium]|nr:NAD(P)H-hydrate dehydratase [Pseudomonadota bacterium]